MMASLISSILLMIAAFNQCIHIIECADDQPKAWIDPHDMGFSDAGTPNSNANGGRNSTSSSSSSWNSFLHLLVSSGGAVNLQISQSPEVAAVNLHW